MNNKFKKIIIYPLITILVILMIFLCIELVEYKQKQNIENIINNESNANDYYNYNGKQYVENDKLQLILCVGLDSYDNEIKDSYMNDELADCIVLLVLDKDNKTILPIQINRDTMCNFYALGIGGRIANETYGQIALSHSYGTGDIDSLVNVKDAVSKLLGNINIDYYMSLTMNAVGKINDSVGGVKVLVEDDFSSIDETLIQSQEVLLLGDHALTFVRTRNGLDDPSNLNRLNRQRVYLRSLYETCKSKVLNDSNFVFNSLNSVNEYIIANTNIYGLSDIANTLLDYQLLDAVQLKGEAIKGDMYMEYHLDVAALNEFIVNTFYVEK